MLLRIPLAIVVLITVPHVAGCIAEQGSPDVESSALSESGLHRLGSSVEDEAGAAGDRTWSIPASHGSRVSLGVSRWSLTIRTDGTVVMNGYRSNGSVRYWQAWYQSGSGANPWNIYETEQTFLAVRQDETDSYAEPSHDDARWSDAEMIYAAFRQDAQAFFGRVVVASGPSLRVPGVEGAAENSTDGSSDCGDELYYLRVQVAAYASTVNLQSAVCMQALEGSAADRQACLDATRDSLAVLRIYLDEMGEAEQACSDTGNSSPPPGEHTPPPPPGGTGGGCSCSDSYQSWENDDTSYSEWYFNSWKFTCATYSVTVCTPDCTTSEETDCWYEQQ